MTTLDALCAAIVANTTTSVKLTDYRFYRDEFNKLVGALKVNTSVTSINLWSCDLGRVNCEEMFSTLSSNVTHLNLSQTWFNSESARALANLLKTNTSLMYIDVSRNCMTDGSLYAFIDALTTNTTVLSLTVRCGCSALNQIHLSELSTLCARNVAIAKTKRMILLARSALMRCLPKTHYDMIRAMVYER